MNYRVMCQTDVDLLARQERCQDLLRDAEHARLIRTLRLKPRSPGGSLGKWLLEFIAGKSKRMKRNGVTAPTRSD